jgi:hypothetical protein
VLQEKLLALAIGVQRMQVRAMSAKAPERKSSAPLSQEKKRKATRQLENPHAPKRAYAFER